MTYGLWLSAGGLQVNEYRQALVANNLANADTVGFKHDIAVFHERSVESAGGPGRSPDPLYAHPMLDALTGGVWVRPSYTSFAQGELEETGRTLDMAIFGEGFFTVSDGDSVYFTRDGRFLRNPQGELVMAAGDGRYKALDGTGAPIVLGDPSLGAISVGRDGTIHQGGASVARLGLVDFADRNMLRKVGNSVFQNLGKDLPVAATPVVKSGYVERATVNPISALTGMIEVSRAYEMNARMVSLQDETLAQAVNRVGRLQ